MTTPALEVTVALCIHKRTRDLAEVFQALVDQRNPPGFEVLIVLNATPPAAAETVRELLVPHALNVRIVDAPKIGLSHARNKAIDECQTRYLIFLDDDAVPASDWLAAMVGEAKAHGARILGGRTILRWDFPRPEWFEQRYDKFLSCIDLGDETLPVTGGHVLVGANILYDMAVFASGLRFDVRLGRIGDDLLSNEELALNRELTRQGVISHYTGRGRVDHIVDPNRVTPEWLAERIFAQGRSWRIHHALELNDEAFAKELNRHVKEFVSHVQNFGSYRQEQWRGWIEFARYAGYLIEHARQSGVSDAVRGRTAQQLPDETDPAISIRRLFEDAVDAHQAGSFERARELFTRLSGDPQYGARAWLHLGDIALAVQQWPMAGGCYRQSLDMQPLKNPAIERIPVLLQRWADNVSDPKRKRSLRLKALKLLGQQRHLSPLQRYQRASIQKAIGCLESARTTFESLSRHPELGAGASFHLGLIASTCRDWREAARWYRRCLKLQPAHQAAAQFLHALPRQSRSEEGASSRTRSTKLEPVTPANEIVSVSVVMPAYNAAAHIRASIESVKRQDISDWELLVVDDGSTDATVEIVRECQRVDSRIRLLANERSKGPSGARNTGIVHARAEFVSFLDADDFLSTDALNARRTAIMNDPLAIGAFSNHVFTDEKGRVVQDAGPCNDYISFTDLFQNKLATSMVMLRKAPDTLFDEEFRCGEDWELWVRLTRQGYRFVKAGESRTFRRLHPQSLSHGNVAADFQDRQRVVDIMWGEDPRVNARPAFRLGMGMALRIQERTFRAFALYLVALYDGKHQQAADLAELVDLDTLTLAHPRQLRNRIDQWVAFSYGVPQPRVPQMRRKVMKRLLATLGQTNDPLLKAAEVACKEARPARRPGAKRILADILRKSA